ncbi:12997_t:CDS:2 [Acaulospora colombiana]|uniref:12997_t:CDS:1 n=1 Tax=Acaulospora colombiana TaxID=27376 RepID=A0ACA9KVU1_9GLOM|nr:12997_t:CDS:2 [Acaulospora colombiana]
MSKELDGDEPVASIPNGRIEVQDATNLLSLASESASIITDSITPFIPLMYLSEIEGGIADQVSGINAKLDDITQWNIAWQNRLLSNNEEILAAATIPISEIHDPPDHVRRGTNICKKIRKGEEIAIKKRVFGQEEKKWMAPEKLRDHANNPYTVKCEIYSFGMLLWEIAEEKLPFHEYYDIVQIRNLVVEQRNGRELHIRDSPNARPLLKDMFMTLNGIYQSLQPKKSPSQTPKISPAFSDLPNDDDDLSLSLDMTDFDICTMSVREAISEHKKKNGDKLKAWKAFSRHAEFGDTLARYWKGYYLYYDLCPIEDPSNQRSKQERVRQAVELFKEAAGTGLAESVKRDIKESIKYFTWAAENGNSTALYNIGNIYYNGIGATKDEEKGIRYLRLAALLGQPKALAMCKAKGITLV